MVYLKSSENSYRRWERTLCCHLQRSSTFLWKVGAHTTKRNTPDYL